jgi:soluble lytic murein transglycosylase
MYKFILHFLIFSSLIFSSTAFAQTLSERHQKIRAAVEERNYATAAQELQDLRRENVQVFLLNNYDYLLGRIAENRRDVATAAASYQSVVKRDSILKEYALWHLAVLMRGNGSLNLERIYLQQLLTAAPQSLLKETVLSRLARSYFESGDYAAAVQSLKSNVQSQTVSESKATNQQPAARNPQIVDREKLALLGQALQKSNQILEAKDVFTKLISNLPNPAQPDDFALAAARGLDEIYSAKPEDFGKRAPQLPDHEHLRRALVYQFNRDFAHAQLHYGAIVERYPNSPNKPDAFLQLGRIANLENRFTDAIPLFERLLAEFPEHPSARDALSFEASAYARLGNVSEAVSRYERFIQKYIESGAFQDVDNPERPYLNVVDAFRDAGRDGDALLWVQKTREKFAGKMPAALALFSQVRIHLAQENWSQALRDLTELDGAPDLGGMRAPGSTSKGEIAFLKAYCLEQLNRTPEAFNAYLAIVDGRNEYYGWRATERLIALGKTEKNGDSILARLNLYRQTANQAIAANDFERARQSAQNALRLTDDAGIRREMLDVARRAYEKLPAYQSLSGKILELGRQKLLTEKPATDQTANLHQNIADELLFLRLYDEATPQLAVASPKSKVQSPKPETNNNPQRTTDNELNYTIAVFYKRGDLAHKAVAFAEPLWRAVPADYLVELAPREWIELLYPAPYTESLLEFAPPRQIDPRFALSIMRQESRYRADVKSYAAARGSMQFISTTSNQIARQLNLPNFRQDDLYDPATSILFGSQYLSNIFNEFPRQPAAVAAAYNGGETNVTRWIVRSRSTEPDRYVPEIQFAQSKDYVFKVLANYRVYQTLYDENLRRR